MGNPTTRLTGIDNLRVVVVLLVIVLHTGLGFMMDMPGAPGLVLLVRAVDAPIMLILYFIAGYFAVYSLRRNGARRFLVEKVRRVGVPWVVGTVVLAPLAAYPAAFLRGTSMNLFEFYRQSPYWFLGLLFWMLVVLTCLYRIPWFARWFNREPDENCRRCRDRRHLETLLFFGVTTLLFFFMHQRTPLDTWSHWNYLVMGQPNRAPLYGAYFGFGLLAGRGNYLHREWLREDRAWPRARFWLPVAMVVLGAYLLNRVAIPDGRRMETGVQATTALLFNGTALSWLMVSIIAARTILQRCNDRWDRLTRNTYGVFVVHPLILYPLVPALRPLGWMPLTVRFILVVLVTAALSWLLVEIGRYVPGRKAGPRTGPRKEPRYE